MAYDESLARRTRTSLARWKGFSEKKMFGGVGFLLNGNMCVGVWKEFLILRIGPNAYETTLAEPFIRPFDITGRSMKGWVMVEPDGCADEQNLKEWVRMAIHFTKSLPPKETSEE